MTRMWHVTVFRVRETIRLHHLERCVVDSQENARQALADFFTESNLTALRELAPGRQRTNWKSGGRNCGYLNRSVSQPRGRESDPRHEQKEHHSETGFHRHVRALKFAPQEQSA
jgi:hypothetical protein